MARRLYPGIFPIAVEPNAACWEDLHGHGALIVPAAVWTSFGYQPFYVGEYEVSSTLISEKTTGGISPQRREKIPTVTLSSVVAPIPITDTVIVKMDIEGAEYEVLEHAIEGGVLDRVKELFVDFHSERILNFPLARHNALVRKLLSMNFELPKWNPNTGAVTEKTWLR